MIAEKLQGWWRRQRNYNIPKRKTIGEWGEAWFHSCHSPTRYPVCREHGNAVKSWSWLAQFELLICDNFTQQQELASGGSGHQVSVLKEVRLVLCISLLFACRGFGRLKRGIAMYRTGTAHPAKHVLSSRTACAVPGNKAAKLLRDVGHHTPMEHPAHRAAGMGKAQPLHLCNAEHRRGFQSRPREAVCPSHWWQT